MLTIDPCNHFPDVSPERLSQVVGILPVWAMDAVYEQTSMKDALIKNYPYYFGPMEGGEVNEVGIYRYPGDPPLYPVLKLTFLDETAYFYEHAMLAVVNRKTGETWVTRMD